jgi:pimeloyl-ACP methyl ester carboxylesterase
MRNNGIDRLFLNSPPGFEESILSLAPGNMRLVHGGQGPPLILVHGLGGSSEDFFQCAPRLAKERTLYIPDLLGSGCSDKPDVPYTLDWFLNLLREMHGVLGLGPAAWLGHSMGGLLCLRMALHHAGLVDRVIAVCPAGGHKKLLLRWRLMRAFMLDKNKRLRIRWTQPLRLYFPLVLFNEFSPMVHEFSRRFIRRWQGPERDLLERSFVRAALSIFDSPIWQEADSISRPVFMITGRRDLVTTREQTQRLARHLPPSKRLLELDGGHMLPYTHACELSRPALDFCREPR